MKKIVHKVLLVLMAAAVLSMVGCQKEAEETKVLDMETVYQSIIALQEESGIEAPIMFPESGEDFLEMIYPGFSAVARTQTVAYMAPVTGFATEIMLP